MKLNYLLGGLWFNPIVSKKLVAVTIISCYSILNDETVVRCDVFVAGKRLVNCEDVSEDEYI